MLRGKLAPKPQPQAAIFDDLFRGGLPAVPAHSDWSGGLQQHPVFLNDALGDCTWAAQANRIRVSTFQAWGDEYVLPDDLIESGFLEMTGGDRTTGLFTTDVLTHFSTRILQFPGRQYGDLLHGWAAVDHADVLKRRLGVAYFNGGSLGMALPKMADALFSEGRNWDVPAGQSLTGAWKPADGHEVWVVGQDANGLWVITWGRVVYVTNAWLAAYADELYVAVSPLLFDTAGLSDAHVDLDYLENCMAKLREGA